MNRIFQTDFKLLGSNVHFLSLFLLHQVLVKVHTLDLYFLFIFINDIKSVIHHSQFLLFADDLKILKPITEFSDKVRLQNNIDSVGEWTLRNELSFNIDKYSSMEFQKYTHTYTFFKNRYF